MDVRPRSEAAERRQLDDYQFKKVTTILDASDRRIGELGSEHRTVVAYDKIPPVVVDAFVAAEDNHFWTHAGVDYMGMARAFVQNLIAGQPRRARRRSRSRSSRT